MFYVSSIRKDGMIGITDTKDNVEEFYSKDFILDLAKKVEIDGVDLQSNNICIVRTVKTTLMLFREGDYHLAISTMSIFNNAIGLKFKSKPSNGFINNQVLNISRSGINSFSYDMGYSKSYRSGLTLDDILMVLEQFSSWRLVDSREGRF